MTLRENTERFLNTRKATALIIGAGALLGVAALLHAVHMGPDQISYVIHNFSTVRHEPNVMFNLAILTCFGAIAAEGGAIVSMTARQFALSAVAPSSRRYSYYTSGRV